MYAFYYNLCKCPEGRKSFDFSWCTGFICLYVEKYEVKGCKTLVFYSFAYQYCNDSFVVVFSYLESHAHRHNTLVWSLMHMHT